MHPDSNPRHQLSVFPCLLSAESNLNQMPLSNFLPKMGFLNPTIFFFKSRKKLKFFVKASQNPGHKIFLIADLPLMGISEPGLIIKSRLKTDQNSYEIFFSRSQLRRRKKIISVLTKPPKKVVRKKNRGSVKTRKKMFLFSSDSRIRSLYIAHVSMLIFSLGNSIIVTGVWPYLRLVS